jgi:hypothetical protein
MLIGVSISSFQTMGCSLISLLKDIAETEIKKIRLSDL